MNAHQLIGPVNFCAGFLLEKAGQLTGNKRWQHTGVSRQMRGTSQSLIGDAQNIIKRCTKRQQVRPQLIA
ncbi:hypothetical protein IMCC9480_2577 [Oxalobacteraceae bacterium IMCC9480]|nr:hypothetical protein IMCC9480_2577 [Oxalobacteraceae bacterium IMCC9480]NDP59236.1 CsbD family protein [Oxalobacteraceae bacterium]